MKGRWQAKEGGGLIKLPGRHSPRGLATRGERLRRNYARVLARKFPRPRGNEAVKWSVDPRIFSLGHRCARAWKDKYRGARSANAGPFSEERFPNRAANYTLTNERLWSVLTLKHAAINIFQWIPPLASRFSSKFVYCKHLFSCVTNQMTMSRGSSNEQATLILYKIFIRVIYVSLQF